MKTKRFLPYKSKTTVLPISHETINAAIAVFQKRGGLIKKLPSELSYSRKTVGRHWDSTYESLFEHI